MFGFLIKKAFFDTWDHLLPAIGVNLVFIAILAIPILLPPALVEIQPVAGIVALVAGILLLFVFLGGASTFAQEVVDYHSIEARSLLRGARSQYRTSLVFGLLVLLHLTLVGIALPVYSQMGNLFGLFAMAILFWLSVIWMLMWVYIHPVRGRLNVETLKVLKKSFLLVLDNPFYSLFVGLGGVVILVVSLFTAFLLPGIAGVMIWVHAAVKLRLYKYDYLEEHPEKGPIPWDVLLYDDRERVGKRTLRGMIFPWKE